MLINYISIAELRFSKLQPLSGETLIFVQNTSYFSVILFIIPSLIYGLYPLGFSTKNYFFKRGYKNIVREFEIIKKYLVITIPIVLFTLFAIPVIGIKIAIPYFSGTPYFWEITLLIGFFPYSFSIFLLIAVIAGSIRIFIQMARKEFRFYFAKGCCSIILETEDELEKVKYLFYVLDSYNKYLQRKINFEIALIKKTFSKFMCLEINDLNIIIKSVCESLEADKLKLARYLIESGKISDKENVFVRQSLIQKLKVIGIFLATAIPIIISVIGFIVQISSPKI